MPTPKPSDIIIALTLLTRLPMPQGQDWTRQAQAAWAYPLVGALLGGLAWAGGWLALALGLPAQIAAFVSLIVLIVLSGAMHEDGLADCADGFWGGFTPERRLEIMRDSQIGSYGVIALVLSLLLRWLALWLVWDGGVALEALLVAGMLSRMALPVLMAVIAHARGDGLSHSVGRVPKEAALLSVLIGCGAAVVLSGAMAPFALIAAGLAGLGMASLARRKIGGQTGDVLGGTQQAVEIAVLLALLP